MRVDLGRFPLDLSLNPWIFEHTEPLRVLIVMWDLLPLMLKHLELVGSRSEKYR